MRVAEGHGRDTLPPGPAWVCKTIETEVPTKNPVHLFYRDPLNCLQALLSNLLLTSHIPFVPQEVWMSAAKICRIYDKWLSGNRAWKIQVSSSSDGELWY